MRSGRVELTNLHSSLLEGNLLGDPADREVMVYLPPGYDEGAARYPLLMVLPPYAASHRSFTNYRVWEPDLFDRYEALLARGEVPPAILVAPDCMAPLDQPERAPVARRETFDAEFRAGLGYHQPASTLASVGVMAAATGGA